MIPRFGFLAAKKGVWEVVKISTGPWVQYADHEQALAEIERENVENLKQIDEEHEKDLAEKDQEIQQIREHEFQNGCRDGEAAAEAKYQTLLAQAVRFAQFIFTTNNIYSQNPVYKEAKAFLKEHL